MYMYPFRHNHFELSTVIVISYKSLSLNQNLKNSVNLTSRRLNYLGTRQNKLRSYEENINKTQINGKQNLIRKYLKKQTNHLKKTEFFIQEGVLLKR